MKVLALTKYSYEGPSSRYRFYNYQKCFNKNRIEFSIKPFFAKSYFTITNKIYKLIIVVFAYLNRFLILINLLVLKNSYDLVIIEYELFPYFPPFFEKLLKKRGIKYIVDYDDAIFHKYDMSSNKIIFGILKDKIAKVIQYAEYVIVCNEYLENYAKRYNTNIMRLPTVVLLENYISKMSYFKKQNEKFIIGWIGSRTTSVYILEILPAIEEFIKKYPMVRFRLVGFDKNLVSVKEAKRYNIDIVLWEESKEIEDILSFDIGIMPLPDNPWSRGKCGFKIIQYMSCKKVVVASPVGINSSLIENGINGFLATSNQEWFSVLEKLYLDNSLRLQMGKNNFKKIIEDFNYSKNCKKYIELINKLG